MGRGDRSGAVTIHSIANGCRAAGRWLVAGLLVAALPAAASAQDSVPADTLARDTTTLAPLTAEAARLPGSAERVPAAIATVDVSDALAARPALGLDEVLDGVPGVYAANRYNFALDQRLAIRGFGARAGFGIRGVRVLLDGVPQTLPDGQSQLTNLQPADLASAEVLRGTASSRFGNASGGVVALRTAALPSEGAEHEVRVSGGSFGTTNWRLRSAGRLGVVAAGVSVSGLATDGHRQHSDAELRQAALSADWTVSGSTLAELRVRLADQPLSLNPGAIDAATYAARADSAAATSITRNARKVVDQQQAALTVRHHTASGGRAAVTAYALRRDLLNPIATNTIIDIDRAAYGARIDASHPLGSSARAPLLGIGVDVQRMRDERLNFVGDGAGTATDEVTVDQRETVTELGPFVLAEWSPVPAWQLSGGLRADWLTFAADDRLRAGGIDRSGERDMSALSGHLGASFSPAPSAVVYVSASTAFETPTTTELANRPGEDGGFNPDLGPQEAVTLEAGGRGSIGPVRWSAAAFRTRVDQAIVQFLAVSGREYFTNAGRTAHDGLEIGVSAEPGPDVALSLAYSYGRYRFLKYRVQQGEAVDTLDGNTIPGVPAHLLDATVSLARGPFTVSVGQSVQSSMWADDANTLEVDGWGWGVTSLRAHARAGWGATLLEPFVAIENLFARPHVGSVTVNGFGGRVLEPAPGRHFYFGLTARYRSAPR